MRLSIHLSQQPFSMSQHGPQAIGLPQAGPIRWFDFSSSRKVRMATGPHGFESLTGFLPASPAVADTIFSQLTTPTVYLSAGSSEVWKGRLEDVSRETGGIQWTAYGPFRYFSDTLLRQQFSTEDISRLVKATDDMRSIYTSAKYVLDKNNRAYVGLRKNETYANDDEAGGWFFFTSYSGDYIKQVEFNYVVALPTGFRAELVTYFGHLSAGTVVWSVTTSGSGSATVVIGVPKSCVAFRVVNRSGAPVTYTGDTGDKYAKWTSLRIKNKDQATVTASYMAGIVLSVIGSINDQVSSSKILIQTTTKDIREAVWEDTRADDLLRDLAATNDSTTDPTKQYQVGMWNDFLHFEPIGTNSITWCIEVNNLKHERSLATIANRIYAVYRDAGNNRMMRTASFFDNLSIEKYGVTRYGYLRDNSTSDSDAYPAAKMLLKNKADPPMRVSVNINKVTLKNGGGTVPMWMVRAGDKLIVRDGVRLPGEAGEDYFEFVIARTELNLDDMSLQVTPEAGSLAVPMALAKRPQILSISDSIGGTVGGGGGSSGSADIIGSARRYQGRIKRRHT